MEDKMEAKTPATTSQSGSYPARVITADRERNTCVCDWEECSQIRELLQEHAPDDDPWKGRLYRVNENFASRKVTALRCSIAHHFSLDSSAISKSTVCVARHHWSRNLIADNPTRSFSTPISVELARKIDTQDGTSRHQEFCNNIGRILSQSSVSSLLIQPMSTSDLKSGIGTKFVQAPVVSKEYALHYVQAFLNSSRGNRAQKRQSASAVSTTKKIKVIAESPQLKMPPVEYSQLPKPSSCPETPQELPIQKKTIFTPDVLPSHEKLCDLLVDRFETSRRDLYLFSEEASVQRALALLQVEQKCGRLSINEPILQLRDNSFLFLCASGVAKECFGWTIRALRALYDDSSLL